MKASPRCATCCGAGTRSLRARRAPAGRDCATTASRGSSSVSAGAAKRGAPASTPPLPQSWCPLPASVTSSIRRASARSAPGASIPTSWAPAFRNSVHTSISAASTIAATSPSPAVRCVPHRRARSIPTGWSRTSGSMRRSASLLGPAAGVAGGDLGHHLGERVVEVDALRVGDADHDKENVGELHGQRAGRLIGFLLLRTELVIDLASELTDFLGEPRHVGERREIARLELTHPLIHALLRFTEAHG